MMLFALYPIGLLIRFIRSLGIPKNSTNSPLLLICPYNTVGDSVILFHELSRAVLPKDIHILISPFQKQIFSFPNDLVIQTLYCSSKTWRQCVLTVFSIISFYLNSISIKYSKVLIIRPHSCMISLAVSFAFSPDIIYAAKTLSNASCLEALFLRLLPRSNLTVLPPGICENYLIHGIIHSTFSLNNQPVFSPFGVDIRVYNNQPKPINSRRVAVVIGAGHAFRRMSTFNYIRLLRLLYYNAYVPILISGPVEIQELEEIIESVPFSVESSLGCQGLGDMALLFSSASTFVAHDSGLSHLAGIFSKSGILLTSATYNSSRDVDNSYYRFRPLSSKLIIIPPVVKKIDPFDSYSEWDISSIVNALGRLNESDT